MRKALSLVGFLLLALAACAETPVPTQPPARSGAALLTVPAATPTSSRLSPTPTPPILPSVTPAAALDVEPTTLPTRPPSRPPADESPWPHFLHELDFGIPAGNSYSPQALAIHPGLARLYVRSHTRSPDGSQMDAVTMLDLTDGQVLGIAEIAPRSYDEGLLLVDPVGDRVYATNPDDYSLSILDAETLTPVITLGAASLMALDAEGNRLYIAEPNELRVLDAADYVSIADTSLPRDIGLQALAVDPGADRIALAYKGSEGDTLTLYNATTLDRLSTIPLPGSTVELVADPKHGQLHLLLDDGDRHLLWTLDRDAALLREQRLGDSAQTRRLAFDPQSTCLFVAREAYKDNGITVFDPKTGQEIADIPLDLPPSGLAWDGDRERLLISHPYVHQIGVIDPQSGEVTDVYPITLNLMDLALDPGREHLYITDSAGQLYVLDSIETSATVADRILAILPGDGRVALDSPHGRLYTGGRGADRVRIFDTDSLAQTGEIPTGALPVADAHNGGLYLVDRGVYLTSLETLTITGVISDTLPQNPGYSLNPTAIDAVVDPGSGRLFVIFTNGVPGSNGGTYLYVYEPETYEKVLADTERSPLYLDLDPATGWAYVSRIHMTNLSTSLLRGGREYTARLESVYGALRLDPALGRVYLSTFGDSENQLFILDAETLHTLGSVPMPAGFTLRALDPQRHRLYLATSEGKVQVWSATGGELPSGGEPIPGDMAARGPYELFLPPGDEPLFALDKAYHLYRSGDQGQNWERITGGLPDEWVLDVAFSPNYAVDQTLFAGVATAAQGFGVWKSTNGGQSWRMTSTGLTDLAVEELEISPEFDEDQILCAKTRRNGLFCSDDGGQVWVSVPEDSPQAFSSSFMSEHPQYGWSNYSGLLRSNPEDGTRQAASIGLVITQSGSGRVLIPPDLPSGKIVYLIWSPIQEGEGILFYRSVDQATSWERLVGEPPQGATPVELTGDGAAFVALDGAGRLRRWPVAHLDWEPSTIPPIDQVPVDQLVLSPNFVQDQALFALSMGSGIQRSDDAGLTWTETGFPVRSSYGPQEELVVVAPDTAFIGTALGLYRFDGEGVWTLVKGGLPPGVSATSPVVATDSSLRVLVSGEHEGDGPRVFLSTDRGQTWTKPLPDLPYFVDRDRFYFSPAFATDKIAFAVARWKKPLRTIGGGEWEEFGPPGDWQSDSFYISPAFDREGLLFMTIDDESLWRSTDAGDSWLEIETPWAGKRLYKLFFSPNYAQDGVFFAWADDSFFRSTDQGDSFAKVLDLGPSYLQFLFSPDHASDGVIYILQNGILYHSADGGQAWRELSQTPWESYAEIKLRLSPSFAQDRTLLAWESSERILESPNGGTSWHDVSQGAPSTGTRDVLFSPAYATDGLLYLVPRESGLYKRVGGSTWQPITKQIQPPTPQPPPTVAPTPSPTALPTACAVELERFRDVWQQPQVRASLGCPQQAAEQILLAEQPFERGLMIWDSSSGQIYVLSDSGSWQAYADDWTADQPDLDPALVPPASLLQPQRGFGKVWREQLGGPDAAIGWALEEERPITGWRQSFEGGLLVWTDTRLDGAEGTAYLLYHDGGWQAVPTQ